MKLPKTLVKIYLRVGFQLEGYIISWSDNISLIKLREDNSLFYILNTKEEVFGIREIDEKQNKKPIKNNPGLITASQNSSGNNTITDKVISKYEANIMEQRLHQNYDIPTSLLKIASSLPNSSQKTRKPHK